VDRRGNGKAALAVTRSILALVVVLAMAAAVGAVFAMFASPRGCGVYTVEADSGAIRCVEGDRRHPRH
jgi:hypothetical protein